jgi:hypothetical protein
MGFGGVTRGRTFSNHLCDSVPAKCSNYDRADEKREQQRGDSRASRAEADVAKQSEETEVSGERNK